jgi:anti-anti-sigma factor
MEITVTTMNGRVPVQVLHVHGNIDSSNYETFQAKAKELIGNGYRYILIDLNNVPYLSSAGLRVIQSIYNQLRTLDTTMSEEEVIKGINAGTYKSPNLKVTNLSKAVKEVFAMSGFDMFIGVFTDVMGAVNSF